MLKLDFHNRKNGYFMISSLGVQYANGVVG